MINNLEGRDTVHLQNIPFKLFQKIDCFSDNLHPNTCHCRFARYYFPTYFGESTPYLFLPQFLTAISRYHDVVQSL